MSSLSSPTKLIQLTPLPRSTYNCPSTREMFWILQLGSAQMVHITLTPHLSARVYRLIQRWCLCPQLFLFSRQASAHWVCLAGAGRRPPQADRARRIEGTSLFFHHSWCSPAD